LRIKENLLYLNTHKKARPRVKLYNVIFNMNYGELNGMIEFAAETNSEFIEFTLVDTVPGATDVLHLNNAELAILHESCMEIKSKCYQKQDLELQENIDKVGSQQNDFKNYEKWN